MMIDARGHRVSAAGRAAEPYLSVVVTTRNDDHGHNPLGRFQAFINCLVAQSRRVNLPTELIVVEWNPPADRPALRESLTWPLDDSPCTVRIIQVPAELHRTLKHPDDLPLYQMIAKNVGIRRALGQFVLSTNIDILLSNELIDYIAGENLKQGVMYRVDRHDVEADVPVDAPLDVMMSYCCAHQVRKHTRWGSFPVDSFGARALFSPDIVAADAGIRFGEGWHVCEGAGEDRYRWASTRAEIFVDDAPDLRRLNIDAESNPFDPNSNVDVSIADAAGGVLLAPTALSGRGVLQIVVPPGATHQICLEGRTARDDREAFPIYEDRDQLVYRVLRIWWDAENPSDGSQSRPAYPLDRWRAAEGSGTKVELVADGLSIVTGTERLSYAAEYGPMVAPVAGTYRFWITLAIAEGAVTVQTLSGDRARFLPSTSRSFLVRPGLRIVSLAAELAANQAFSLIVSNFHPRDGERSRLIVRELRGSHRVEQCMQDPGRVSASPAFGAVAASAPEQRVAIRSFRQRILDRLRRPEDTPLSIQRETVIERVTTTPSGYAQLVEGHRRLAALEPLRALIAAVRPDRLHTNASGDFQLMSRDDWFELRGFAEFELYSMNIDSLFCHTARYAGLSEHVFQSPMCAYHIEHEIGSGWTPEGETKLRTRIAERGIGWLDNGVVSLLASLMKWVNRPMIFNGSDWGFRQHEFSETVLSRGQVENRL